MKRYLPGFGTVLALLVSLDRAAEAKPRPSAPRTPVWFKAVDQGGSDPRLKGYFAPQGIKVEIVTDGPTVTDPDGMTFGDDGTLYVLERRGGKGKEVTEEVTYKDGSRRKFARFKESPRDLIKVLGASKGGAAHDKPKVIVEDELPSAMLLHDGWLYLAGRGSVRRYKPSKPDGPYDIKETIVQGLASFPFTLASGLTVGNDGWLYVTAGAGDHYAEGSDGSRATVLRTGAVFRCRPNGSKLHVYAIGLRNPRGGVVCDAAGNLFAIDGAKPTASRLLHVTEESDFGWRSQSEQPGARDPYRSAVAGERPGTVAPLLSVPGAAPASLLIYNDDRLPVQYHGLLYFPDAVDRRVRAYRVEPEESTFTVTEEFDLLRSEDSLFCPCHLAVGPDGAVYICDRRMDLQVPRLPGEAGKPGRIYRLSWSGTEDDAALPLRGMDSWAKIARMSEEELLQTLASEAITDRQKAQQQLVRRGDKARPGLLKLLDDRDQPLPARIAALGALQSMWNGDVEKLFIKRLRDPDEELRRLAADALALNGAPGDRIHNALLQNLADPEPAVRRAMALAMGRINAEGAADVLVTTFKTDDSKDPVLYDGLLRAIERTGKSGIQQLLDVVDSGVKKDRDKVYTAFLALRTRPAAEAIPTLLRSPHPSVSQRASLIRSYTNYQLDPPVSLEPLLDYLLARPAEAASVKDAIKEVLSACDITSDRKLKDKAQQLLRGLDN